MPFRIFKFFKMFLASRDAILKTGWTLVAETNQTNVLATEPASFDGRNFAAGDLRFQPVDAIGELSHFANQWTDATRSETEFFDQDDQFFSTTEESGTSRRLLSFRNVFVDLNVEIFFVFANQIVHRAEIVWHPLLNLFLGQVFGQRNLDRAIERKFSSVNALESFQCRRKSVVATKYATAIARACDFNAFRQSDFFVSRQQWNDRHLAEIHSNWIIAGSRKSA